VVREAHRRDRQLGHQPAVDDKLAITDNDTKHINKLLTPIHGGSGHADLPCLVPTLYNNDQLL